MNNWDDLDWRTSTKSAGGNCVEVAPHNHHVHVRDSKDPDGPMLTVDGAAWRAFLASIKETDLGDG
jgi:hypothetical protein